MQATLRYSFLTVAALLVTASGCDESPRFSMLGRGAGSTADGYSFSAGSIFLQEHEPGVLFGAQKTPHGHQRFTCFVIFRHAVDDEKFGISRPRNQSLSFDGSRVLMTDGITIDGKAIQLDLQLQVDRVAGTVQATEFAVDGSDIDPSDGVLILADLRTLPVTYRQVNARLPEFLGDPVKMEPTVVRKPAREVTQKLRTENADVRNFFRE